MNPFTTKPYHQHDCPDCGFYGHVVTAPRVVGGVPDIYDLYICPNSHTLIARFGEMGDYITASIHSAEHYELEHPIRQLLELYRELGDLDVEPEMTLGEVLAEYQKAEQI